MACRDLLRAKRDAIKRRSLAERSRPAAGSSNKSSSGSAMRALASSTCWRSPSERSPKATSRGGSEPGLIEQGATTFVVVGGVVVPPGLERTMTSGHNGFECRDRRAELAQSRLAHEADAPSHGPRVGAPCAFAEDIDVTSCRKDPHTDDRQKRGLARTVRPEDHPAFSWFCTAKSTSSRICRAAAD